MTYKGNKEKILGAALELFNERGATETTTNHLASHLGISPGNLYFHFRNKEQIVRELFDRMCENTYGMWTAEEGTQALSSPQEFIERSLEIFWVYRFFHREMYNLRRRDPELSRKWKRHWVKTERLLQATYKLWVRNGLMKPVRDPRVMKMICDVTLVTSSSFFQFFESAEKPAARRPLRPAAQQIAVLLLPYATPVGKSRLTAYLSEFKA